MLCIGLYHIDNQWVHIVIFFLALYWSFCKMFIISDTCCAPIFFFKNISIMLMWLLLFSEHCGHTKITLLNSFPLISTIQWLFFQSTIFAYHLEWVPWIPRIVATCSVCWSKNTGTFIRICWPLWFRRWIIMFAISPFTGKLNSLIARFMNNFIKNYFPD